MTLRIRTLVVDDEPFARANLRVLIGRDPQLELVGECASGEEALAAIRAQAPALVFLDVQMPGGDGFDVLEQLGAQAPPAIVFVTAFDEYALRAFDAGALDYLLKPYDDARFAQALARAKARLAGASAPARPEHVTVRVGRQVLFVPLADIDWIEAADYCVALHAGAKTYLLRRSMSAVEAEFERAGFCRVHRSAIVNLARVRGLETGADGESEVLLKGEGRLPLSRRHRATLLERLDAHHGARG